MERGETRSGDTDMVTIRLRNSSDTVICTIFVGPEVVITDPAWAHPHSRDARNPALSDAYWGNQPNRVAAARWLRQVSDEIWRIGSGAAVYCTEGRHRSPSAVGAFLIDHYNLTPERVIQLFESAYENFGGEQPDFAKIRSILDGYQRAKRDDEV